MIRISPHGSREVLLYGGPFLLIAIAVVIAAAGIGFSPFWSLIPLIGFVAILGFFRDPSRTVPAGDDLVISPADGKVVDIEELDETDFVGARAVRIGIFLSVFNVHVNRSPVRGSVEHIQYKEGAFHSAFTAETTKDNESNALGLVGKDGLRVMVRQISGAIARRIVCAVKLGASLDAGERFGLIKFGSRTEVFLPVDRVGEIRVKLGDKVRGGETVLATFR